MEQEISLDLRAIYYMLRKRLVMIIAITLVAAITSGIVSFLVLTPIYESKISIVIGKTPTENGQKQQYEYSDIMMYQNLIKTYAKIAQSRTVAQNTISRLSINSKVEEVMAQTSVTPQNDTQIMDIKVRNISKVLAKDLVNALATEFIKEAKRIYPDGNVQIIDKAVLPRIPVKPNKKLNVAIAFMLGFMVSIGLAFVLEYMDNTIKTEQDIEKTLGLPVLGIIPKFME